MTSRRRLSVLVAVGALLVTACGGAASPSPPAAPRESVAPATVEPTAPPAADICTNPPKAPAGTTLTFVSFGGAYQEAQRKGWLEPYAGLTAVTLPGGEHAPHT